MSHLFHQSEDPLIRGIIRGSVAQEPEEEPGIKGASGVYDGYDLRLYGSIEEERGDGQEGELAGPVSP